MAAAPIALNRHVGDRFIHSRCSQPARIRPTASIVEALRQHVEVLLLSVLDTINKNNNEFKLILDGWYAAELCLSPYILSKLKSNYASPVLISGVHLQHREPYAGNGNDHWSPRGQDGEDPLAHPAFQRLCSTIRNQYHDFAGSFRRRELILFLYNARFDSLYDFNKLEKMLHTGSAFTYSLLRSEGQTIWSLDIKLPLIKGGEETQSLIRYTNVLMPYHFEQPIREDDTNKIKLVGEDTRVPRARLWLEDPNENFGLEHYSFPVRMDSNVLIASPSILLRSLSSRLGTAEVAREILGEEDQRKLYNLLQSIGIPFRHAETGWILRGERYPRAQYFHYLTVLACIYVLHESVKTAPTIRLPNPKNFILLFNPLVLVIPEYGLPPVHQADALHIRGHPYPILEYLFQKNKVAWYIFGEGERANNTRIKELLGAAAPEAIKQFNSQLETNQAFFIDRNAVQRNILRGGVEYQTLLNNWIRAIGEGIRLATPAFHTDVLNHLQITNYSRKKFWQYLCLRDDIDNRIRRKESHVFMMNALLFAYNYPEGSTRNQLVYTTRFSYPMPFLYKKQAYAKTRLGIVDTLDIGQVVYTTTFISTTAKQAGDLPGLDTFEQVKKTGYTLYKFILQTKGFLYVTYDDSTRGFALEQEVLIPAWASFTLEKKEWKYIPIIEGPESIARYRSVLVITLRQNLEPIEALLSDIPEPAAGVGEANAVDFPVPTVPIPAAIPPIPSAAVPPAAPALPPPPVWPIQKQGSIVSLLRIPSEAEAQQILIHLAPFSEEFRRITNFSFQLPGKPLIVSHFSCFVFILLEDLRGLIVDSEIMLPRYGFMEPLVRAIGSLEKFRCFDATPNTISKTLDSWMNFLAVYYELLNTVPIAELGIHRIYNQQSIVACYCAQQLLSHLLSLGVYTGGSHLRILDGSRQKDFLQHRMTSSSAVAGDTLLQYRLLNSYGLIYQNVDLHEFALARIVEVYALLREIPGPAVVPSVNNYPMCNYAAAPLPIQESVMGTEVYTARQMNDAERLAFGKILLNGKNSAIADLQQRIPSMSSLVKTPPEIRNPIIDGFFYQVLIILNAVKAVTPALQEGGLMVAPSIETPDPRYLLLTGVHRLSYIDFIKRWIDILPIWIRAIRPEDKNSLLNALLTFLLLRHFTVLNNQLERDRPLSFFRPTTDTTSELLLSAAGLVRLVDHDLDIYLQNTEVRKEGDCFVLKTHGIQYPLFKEACSLVLKMYLLVLRPQAGGRLFKQTRKHRRNKNQSRRKPISTRKSQ